MEKILDINTRDYDEIVDLLEIYKDNINNFLMKRTTLLPNIIIKKYFNVLTDEYLSSKLSIEKIEACKLENEQLLRLCFLGVVDIDYLIKNKHFELVELLGTQDEIDNCKYSYEHNKKLIKEMAFDSSESSMSSLEYYRKILNRSDISISEATNYMEEARLIPYKWED